MIDRIVGALALAAGAAFVIWILMAVVIVLDSLVPWWIPVAIFLLSAIIVAVWDPGRGEG